MIGAVFILAIVVAIVERIMNFLSTGELTFFGISLNAMPAFVERNKGIISVISFSISGLFAFGVVVLSQLRGTVWIEEKEKVSPTSFIHGKPPVSDVPISTTKNPLTDRWRRVEEHIDSDHPSDWRLAIIEADVMLNELLDNLQLPGDTMGDKLKAVEKSDFLTIESAWEAHKIRNQVAHEGSEFLLNHHEAKRIISLYTQVFKEFHMI